MKKLAIIGASYLQEPLIIKAKEMGFETHVFAWKCGDVGESIADYFYPISIVEIDKIVEKCKEIGIDGICTIASDLAVITVNKVAEKLNLPANSLECTELSTNKHKMREAFYENGDPSPKSILVKDITDLEINNIEYPVIVKPTDRSGSRGITKVECFDDLTDAIELAKSNSFEKMALVEEFVVGKEYSVEYFSYEGKHTFLNITEKITTGAPNFIEKGHIEPANLNSEVLKNVKGVVEHALNSLKITFGASHSEIKINKNNNIKIIEIGGRMGGDYIGSDLVKLTTGVDFVELVIKSAMGIKPEINRTISDVYAGVHFIFDQSDLNTFNKLLSKHPEYIIKSSMSEITDTKVIDSSSRFGVFVLRTNTREELLKYMPNQGDE